MAVLVTGGAGFIGSHLVEALVAEGHEVAVLDNLSTGKVSNLVNIGNIRFYRGDLRERAFVFEVISKERPKVVYHLAAQVSVAASVRNPVYDADVNVMGTLHLLEAMVAAGIRKIVFSSTAAVYGVPQVLPIGEDHPIVPLSPYAASKFSGEQYIRMYHHLRQLDYTILRYGNVYGPRQSTGTDGGVVAIFLDKLLSGGSPAIFDDGNQTRDFIYVKDVVAANLKALSLGSVATLNIGTGTVISVNDLLKYLQDITGLSAKVVRRPKRSEDIRHSVLAPDLAREVLGWDAQYTLTDGLRATVLAKTYP